MRNRKVLHVLLVLLSALGLLAASLAVAAADDGEPSVPAGTPAEVAREGAAPSGPVFNAPEADVELIKDDGTREDSLVLRDPNTLVEFHAIFFNRFSASEVAFPFQLESIHYYVDSNNLQGLDVQLLVYSDDGGSVTNATLVYTEVVTISTESGNNVYTLTNPVAFNTPTDILLGISTIYADGGVPWPVNDRYPYTMDTTSPQGDSFLGWMDSTGAAVDVSDLSSFVNLLEMGSLGLPANWMVRGFGSFTGAVPAVNLDMTVGTDPNVCATASEIAIGPGDDVTYCYEVTNSGNVTFTNHSLTDSQLGAILTDFNYTLAPGSSVFLTQTTTLDASVVSTATWTADDGSGPVDGVQSASDSDSATVVVVPPDPLGCNVGIIDFGEGIPSDWIVASGGSSPQVLWTTIAGAGEDGNYTSGSGDAATASSDRQGGGAYDTQLWTNPFSLLGVTTATLTYESNYQNFAGGDFLDLDISTDGGATWTTLLSWNEDHPVGGLRQPPGESVTVGLGDYLDQSGLILRWHYYDPTGPSTAEDWYAQIDNVALSCTGGAPQIALNMGAGLDPAECGTANELTVVEGTPVYYCYEVTNTGTVPFDLHDLDDSQLGNIFSGFSYLLEPSSSVNTVQAGLAISATVTSDTTSQGTWTAYQSPPDLMGGGATATATDTVTVTVTAPTDVAVTDLSGESGGSRLPVGLLIVGTVALLGFMLTARRRERII